jgi:long-chain acyl-CoA synthetase
MKDAGVDRLLSWDEFLQVGADNSRDAVPPKAEDISTVMYTSGTTGATHARVGCWQSTWRAFTARNGYVCTALHDADERVIAEAGKVSQL